MAKQNQMARLALCTCVIAFCVIGLGAFTRLMDAGLGCPDWPFCYGHIIAPGIKAKTEMIHRYFAGTLSFFILILISVGLIKKPRRRSDYVLSALLLALVIYQIVLGAKTVTLKLWPVIVTQHLLGGFLILSISWALYLTNKMKQSAIRNSANDCIFYGMIFGLILLLLQIFLGAWTSTNDASFSCPDIPFCRNEGPWFPMYISQAFSLSYPVSSDARQTIQMMHRFAALLLTSYFFILTLLTWKKLSHSLSLIKLISLLWGLLLLQLTLGMVNVIFKRPIATSVGHTLTAAALVLVLVTLIFELKNP